MQLLATPPGPRPITEKTAAEKAVAQRATAMTRRNLVLAALAAALISALLWALRPAAVQVDIAQVTRGPLRVTVDEEGKTRIKQVFVVSAPVTGRLRRSPLDPGDAVVRNETIIAVIEPTAPIFLDARTRREAEAQVAAAQAAVSLAEAEVRQAETELGWANSELQRSRALSQTNVVSARTYERARLEQEKQVAAVARAKANLELRTAELATAKAHLIGPEAANLPPPAPCCVEVRSPHSGKVLRELQESERVVVAGTPLFEIGDPGELDIVVDLLSADAVRVTAGAEAIVEGAGLPQPLKARVRRVEPAGFTKVSALGIEEQRVRTFLELESPAEVWARLGHDYRVFARIVTWSSPDALRLPLSALFRQGDKWTVYAAKDGRASLRPVTIDHRNNENAEVVSGLAQGEAVVLHPNDRVSDGTRIAPRNGAKR